MSIAVCFSTFEIGKGGTLAHIQMYIVEHNFKILVVIAFARRTAELYTFVILHYELAKRTSPLAFTI